MAAAWRGGLVAGCSWALGLMGIMGAASKVSGSTEISPGTTAITARSASGRIILVAQKSTRQKSKAKAKATKDAADSEASTAADQNSKSEKERLSSPERDKQLETV